MMESTFTAPDIECDGCANSIKRALGRLPGIENVDVDVERKLVTVRHNEAAASDASIRSALDRAGFPVAA